MGGNQWFLRLAENLLYRNDYTDAKVDLVQAFLRRL